MTCKGGARFTFYRRRTPFFTSNTAVNSPYLTPLVPRNGSSPASTTVADMMARGLTEREIEVLRWIAEGKRDGEIAVILGIGVRTVNTHVAHILLKLGAETRTAAVRAAREPASKDRAA